MRIEKAQRRNFREQRPAPAERRAGTALAADLVEEQPRHTADRAVVVRLGDAPATVENELDQPALGNRQAQHAIGVARIHLRCAIAYSAWMLSCFTSLSYFAISRRT
jgi:hypothetical protein